MLTRFIKTQLVVFGVLTVIALPHDWCGYGKVIDGFKAKYGLKVNELNPDAGSADELEAIRANKDNKGPQAPDVIDVGLAFGPQAQKEGLLQPYKVASWDEIPADVKDADVIVTFNGKDAASAPVPANAMHQGPRGTFSPEQLTISLLKKADLSTFLHESGHFFFDNDIALASEILAAQQQGASITAGERQMLGHERRA